MTEEIDNAVAILKRAMQIEQEGREFYLKAAETTEDEKGQETFHRLANDEVSHLRLIRRQYDALTSESQWVVSPEVRPASIDLDKPLFPKGREALEKAATQKTGELEALLFGLEIENRSYDLYRTAASTTGDPLGKEMFEFLAGQEMGHFNVLMMRYDGLAGPAAWGN